MSWEMIQVDPPTEKQIKYATDIANKLKLDVDISSMDKWQMRDFISEHVDEFKSKLREQRIARRRFARSWHNNRTSRRFYTDSDFGCGGEDPICTCFDMGIYPWGDS